MFLNARRNPFFSAKSLCHVRISPRRVDGRGIVAMSDVSRSVESLKGTLSGALGGQLTVGGVAGYATGFAAKRIGQLVAAVVGAEILIMQLMAQRGWIAVDWDAINRDVAPHLATDRVENVFQSVKFQMPFASAFGAGCLVGLKWP